MPKEEDVRRRSLIGSAALVLVQTIVALPAEAQGPGISDFSRDRGFLIAKGTLLTQGEGYVAALVPGTIGAVYGLTSRMTVQGGTVPWTLAYGALAVFASARYGVLQLPAMQVAVGGFGLALFGEDETDVAGWPFLAATVGGGRAAVSALVGVGSSSQILDDDFDGSVLLQGMAEVLVARGLKLIAEGAWLGRDSDALVGGGLRLFGPRVLIEGGFGVEADDASYVVPWAAIAFRW